MNSPVLEMRHITKKFPGVRALDDVTLEVQKGEILGLVGENGAGKSTLMKVLSGVYPHGTYDGEIFHKGETVRFHHINEAKQSGIGIIHQELNLIPELNIAENIFLNEEPTVWGPVINYSEMYLETHKILDNMGIDMNPRRKIAHLTMGKQQLVEIAKAIKDNIEILILDEPTSSLTEVEVDLLYELLRALKHKGVSCIFISHKFKEIFHICDRVSILKDGKYVGTYPIPDLNHDKMVSLMVGRNIKELFVKETADPGECVLEVNDLCVKNPTRPGSFLVDHVSFKARKGEILAFAGLMGSGRTETMMAIFGAYSKKSVSGDIRIHNNSTNIRNPADALKNGIALVTEDRKQLGLHLLMSIKENITLASLEKISFANVINKPKESQIVGEYIDSLKIKTPSDQIAVNTLSGGNQQKVVLGKSLATEPLVLILDEPTRGIDVGAKVEIFKIMNELVKNGVVVIMISSEMLEVLGMADRILVMHEGKITGELNRKEATEEKIMTYATGGTR